MIVNLQKTPIDQISDLRIFAKCDEVFGKVFRQMEKKIPIFKRSTEIKFWCKREGRNVIWKVESWDGFRSPFFSFVTLYIPSIKEFSSTSNSQPFGSSFVLPEGFEDCFFDFFLIFGLFGKEENNFVQIKNSFSPSPNSFEFSFGCSLIVSRVDYNNSLPPKIETPKMEISKKETKKNVKKKIKK